MYVAAKPRQPTLVVRDGHGELRRDALSGEGKVLRHYAEGAVVHINKRGLTL